MARTRELTKRRQLAQVTKRIRRLMGDTAKGIHEIGRELDEVQRTELWRDGGHESFRDYVRTDAGMSLRMAQRFIRVAVHFNAAIAESYGVVKLDAALKYLSATQATEQAGDLLATEIQVRDADGRYQTLSLHDASADQIDEAARLLKQRKSLGKTIPKPMRARADRLAEALRPVASAAGKGAPVKLTRSRGGRYSVAFKGIDYEQLAEFAALVLRHAKQQDDD